MAGNYEAVIRTTSVLLMEDLSLQREGIERKSNRDSRRHHPQRTAQTASLVRGRLFLVIVCTSNYSSSASKWKNAPFCS